MMRALFSAIGGLRSHIAYMDVIGNNLANVNTTAFKASRITFQDMLSQTQVGASAPTSDRGGTNPVQVGLGMTLRSIDIMHTQGALQATGKPTDFAIQGNGFFIVKGGGEVFYTRDGAFDITVNGELVNPSSGLAVQGWIADSNGVVDTTQPLGSLVIPFGRSVAAQETTLATFVGNLDSSLATGGTVTTSLEVYDSLGNQHVVQITFTKTATAGTWDVAVASSDPEVQTVAASVPQVIFDGNGAMTTPAPPAPLQITTTLTAGAPANSPAITDIDVTNLTQFATAGQIATTANNGFSAGSLISFSVGPSGDITGIFSNGVTSGLGRLATALFANPAGLQRSGSNNFVGSANSGVPIIGAPGTGGRGLLGTGLLEGSNTDLATEFTNMVIAQRGFQAAGRVISTADEMLRDLVNLGR